MADKQKLTKAGYKKLQDELKYLVDVAREEIKVQLAEARAQGDLSENADYDAARAKQAEVEGRIKEIENIIANAEIIEEGKANTKKVGLGSTVTIRFLENNKEVSYMIVGTVESDPVNGKISKRILDFLTTVIFPFYLIALPPKTDIATNWSVFSLREEVLSY